MHLMEARRPSDKLSDVACCRLRTPDGEGQCVIAEEKTQNNRTRYMLIANHHTLPTKAKLNDSSLIVAGGAELKPIVPDTTTKCFFYSCCGPDSLWATPTHVPLHKHEEAGCCPRDEDWTVVILDKNFALKYMRTRMTLPCLVPQKQTSSAYSDVGVFERSNMGTITLHSVQPSFKSPERGLPISILQQDVENCLSLFKIQYPYKESGDIGPDCAGGPIFSMDTLSLLGIHCKSPFRRDSSRDYCSGLSINFIISSLYCGGLDIECSLVSTLAFVKDIVHKLKVVPPAAVMDRVSSSIELHKNNQRMELERLQSTMTTTERQEEKRESFKYNVGILEFVLEEMEMILADSFNLASIPDGPSAMKLLAALFSMFDGFERVTDIHAVIYPTTPKENGERTIDCRIFQLCQKLLQVLKNNRQSAPVIKAASELLSTLLNFSYEQVYETLEQWLTLCDSEFPPGPACCFLEATNVRMLGAIAQSDAAKSDVGTMQACYTAYLKILDLSHQNDMTRTRLDGERARQEVEKNLETAKMEIVQLRGELEHSSDREKDLLVQLKETRQQYDELRMKCDQQARQFGGLEERCVQLAADKESLTELKGELTCELTRWKQAAGELQKELQQEEDGPCRTANTQRLHLESSAQQHPAVSVALPGAAIFSQESHLLDTVVDERVFLDLCKTSAVSHWKFVGRYLGVSDAILDTLSVDGHPYGLREVFYNLLKEWKRDKGNAATYSELISALRKEGLPEAYETVQFHAQNHQPSTS